MKRIKTFSQIFESQTQTKIELSDVLKGKYLQQLGEHVTYPEIYEKDPEMWQILVNGDVDEVIEYTSSEFEYTLRDLRLMKKGVENKIWGTPQAAFNNFVGYYSDLGGDDNDWADINGSSVPDYMMFSGQSKEICLIMKALHDGYEIVEWVKVK
jgi:hypothetical protein